MAELGFRPLGDQSSGILDQSDLGAVSTGDLGAISTAPVSQNAPDTLEYQFLRAVEEGPDFALAFARTYKDELSSMVQNNAFDRAESAQLFMQMLGGGLLEGAPTGVGMDMPYALPKFEPIPAEEQDLPPYLNPPVEEFQLPGSLSSGSGGFSTLHRSGESPVDQLNRMPESFGYAHGGYADNSHGTVAGKLGRRGRLPVREEEKEKETKHTDYKEPDWYARMLQSPTLGKVRIA